MKARFKTIFISSFGTLIAFFAITYTSCKTDKCKDTVCAYGGVCDNGTCLCPPGYEDSQCQTVARDKFLGNWSVFEKGSKTNSASYGVIVKSDTPVTRVEIVNFNNYFTVPVQAYVQHDTIIIPNQSMQGKTVFGAGYIVQDLHYAQNAELIVRYQVIDSTTLSIDDYGYDTSTHSSPSLWNK